ncbi:hypothetical protein POV27_08945 [Aureisphaera galaxeae]|uniref:hypothetical protein n=1 Tax=Aureisphaera galaxeae TaxID=1538023 RepID=UPI0023504FE0|nr:hypothetical protein [Aureisphaera galaxeae]MDC8004175.1 hypothetical protein [Aureisphaera galaxeae]
MATEPTTPKKADTSPPKNNGTIISDAVKAELREEINSMISFAVFNGTIINTEILNGINNDDVESLVNTHNLLCKNIAPATPKSIKYIRTCKQDVTNNMKLSKIPLVRNLIILSILFLAIFILTGMSADVNDDSLDKGIMENEGWSLLLNLAFLSSIAGLGVLFYLLKNVTVAVKNSTLVPEDNIYYFALIVLGVISGLILSEIISFYDKDPNSINLFSKSVLALIGGFSSDAIFSVLQGIIDRIKAIFITSS